MARDSFLKTAAPLAALTFYGVYQLTPATALMSEEDKAQVKQTEQSVYYSGCNEVRAAGNAPLFAGQPGYREGMDGDGDGIACEPYRGQ